ncbi:MAG: ATP-dependent metallopeptidase FtsH/Yme1/Tma family protein, partial [Actinomycetota bacterium]|nr:ATP-dependent metallopeptidase FtsH/Yme1/Tma family protein [Actinomycetota bacterium]
MKRWLRGPWVWVVVFAIVVIVVLDVVSSRGGPEEVKTSEMIETLTSGDVDSVLFIDGDQRIEATLTNGDKVTAQWLGDQGIDLLNLVQQEVDQGEINDTYDVEVPTPSLFWTFLTSFFPILLIILFFLFMMNSLQG